LVQQTAVLLTGGDLWRVREAEDCIVDRSASGDLRRKCDRRVADSLLVR
jgi:hypothetical protein